MYTINNTNINITIQLITNKCELVRPFGDGPASTCCVAACLLPVRACVCACVCVCVRACVCASVYVSLSPTEDHSVTVQLPHVMLLHACSASGFTVTSQPISGSSHMTVRVWRAHGSITSHYNANN
jgi:hypothetical protein